MIIPLGHMIEANLNAKRGRGIGEIGRGHSASILFDRNVVNT